MILNVRKLLGMQNQADDQGRQVRAFWLPDLVTSCFPTENRCSNLVSSLISEEAIFLSFELEVPAYRNRRCDMLNLHTIL